ncbi:Hypothetical predicted protein [Mytilus galloprovincialis]|uniref:B box-type domain-containing protein n=1 Tax=Mytilus galloprovincialis TaxID=29158 RepID=A0A8B6FHY5_MYTGA|nr:Hypothetical predicted protein [Mytilus galloprovincialis]
MASSNPIPCGPCQEGKINTKADIWCYNCDEGLCSICSGHHKRSKGTRDHKTIDITSYNSSIQAVKTECDKHGRLFNMYCPSHLMPCCDKCISTNHSKCAEIKSLASVVEKTKVEKSKASVDKDINSILHLLDKMVNNKSKNIKAEEQQCDDIKKSIQKIREKINKHLDHLEKKLCQETDKLWDQEKSTAADFISEVKEEKTKLQKIQEHLRRHETHTTKLQSFLVVHQLEQQVHKCQRYVDDLEDDDRTKTVNIKMKQNDKIENILIKLTSLESLGEVTIDKTETDMNRETSVRREAQVESREQYNINNMTMIIEYQAGIYMDKEITDMICLMDGRFIVAEWLGQLKLLTYDGKSQKNLQIPGEPWGVIQINQNTIAITYPYEKAIKIFNIEMETVTRVLTLDTECYGLSFSNNSLAVGVGGKQIRIIDLDGNTLKSIQVQSKSNLQFFIKCNDRIICGDYLGKAVHCVDGSGKQIWQYTQDLEGPWGLCKDTYGNIIVAEKDCNKIIVISKDGQNSKVLLSEEDEIKHPRCICFKQNESFGFIGNRQGRNLVKFKMIF